MHPSFPLYLFSKAPVPGQVKGRLSPPLTANQSVLVARAMLRHSAARVEQGWPGTRILNAAPDLTHPEFERFVQDPGWRTRIQAEGGLGKRMREALVEGVQEQGAVVVLGTDIPALDASILQQAWQLLSSGQQVVGPSQDGGFYLLGLSRMPEGLLKGIEWGKAEVYSGLMQNAHRLGLNLTPLATLSDCDYYEDLRWVVKSVPEFAQALAETGFDMRVLSL